MYYEISDSILLCFMQKKSMVLPLDYMNSKTRMSKEGRPSEINRQSFIFFPRATWEFWAHNDETYQEKGFLLRKKN